MSRDNQRKNYYKHRVYESVEDWRPSKVISHKTTESRTCFYYSYTGQIHDFNASFAKVFFLCLKLQKDLLIVSLTNQWHIRGPFPSVFIQSFTGHLASMPTIALWQIASLNFLALQILTAYLMWWDGQAFISYKEQPNI